MLLSRNQFEVLVFLEKNMGTVKQTQRIIAKGVNLSVGLVNKILANLFDLGYIDLNYNIVNAGMQALSQYKVKRAIILSAGFGSRLIPITINTPKPLVRVNGLRMIDYSIDILIENEITDITIVRGHLGEQFDQLLYKYPTIKLVDNKNYNTSNNISSALLIKDYLRNTYMIEGDLLIYNKNILPKYQYTSNYIGVFREWTDDWRYEMKNNYISGMTIGGEHCYQMYGVSYWTNKDGEKLSRHIEQVYQKPGGKERFWDQVALEVYNKNYKIEVRSFDEGDIIEIDTYEELKIVDSNYF